MLVSNIFSRKVYPITVIGFVVLEFLFLFIISATFYISLKSNKDYVDMTIFENIREIQNSFSSFLNRRINSAKKDLFLIGKHSDILLGKLNMTIQNDSQFYKYNDNCLINSLDINELFINENINIQDEENSIINHIFNYFDNSTFDSEEKIKYLKNFTFLNNLSYFNIGNDINSKDINYYTNYICNMKIILKSILIKEIISKGEYNSMKNIYLFIDNISFQYPPEKISFNSLKKLPIYSRNIKCQYEDIYTSSCIYDNIKGNLLYSSPSNYSNPLIEYFHIFDSNYIFYSCLNLHNSPEIFDFENNFVCIEHNMKYLLQSKFLFGNITSMNIKINITDLIGVNYDNDKIYLKYSLGCDVNEFYNVYNEYFSSFYRIVKDFVFSEENSQIELFHLIYFNLFKYKKDELTETLIKEIINEYEIIKSEIIKGIKELNSSIANLENNNNFEKTIRCSQHFLLPSYNTSGLIDHENGEIKKGEFVYLITPLIDKNIFYRANLYTKYNSSLSENESRILGFNIIFYQNTLDIWNINIFHIMVLIMFKWLIYFSILIVFLTTFINVLFTKVLDNIFKPISLLYERLSQKLISSKSSLNLAKKSNKQSNEQNEEKSITSEIISLTPEMEELIQLCKFLENITYMKELMLSNEQMELDFDLMNEMYNVLSNKIDMIKYGHFVSRFYFKKKRYIECNNSIKVIEEILESEEDRFKEENENIEIEVINVISSKYYINEFQNSREVFENKTSLSQLNYYELIIIREKLYFFLGICNFFQIIELKKKVKELKKDYELQNKKNYYHNLRGRALTNNKFMTKSNNNAKGFVNSSNYGKESLHYKLNSQVKAMEYLENQIIKKTEIAIKYFKLSYDINNKYCINKIKCIIILLYIAKCQLYKEKKKSEAIDTMKTAIIKLYTLNQEFIKTNEKYKFNPIIMLLINGAIMEQILYLIVKINTKTNNKLAVELLSDIMKLSYFKTDNIQSKASYNIKSLIKKANSNLKNINKKMNKAKFYINKISFFEKMTFRLSPQILSLQYNNPNIVKNIFILFSPNLIKVLPSSIELSEILSKCVRNYMCPNDRIQCLRFDMNYNSENFKTPSELNKDFIIRILQDNDKIKNNKFGMQNCIFSIVHKFNKEKEKKIDEKDEILLDKDIIYNDNYIFQFILSQDYILDGHDNIKKFKEELKSNNISLYTFIFDDDLKINNSKEHNKMNEIIKFQKKIPEGVLIFVDNFLNIKMVFQNISRKYKPKNIFRINSNSYDNIFIDFH
jgi:hypothetical protein